MDGLGAEKERDEVEQGLEEPQGSESLVAEGDLNVDCLVTEEE